MYFPYTFHLPPIDLLVQQPVTASESHWPLRARSSCRSLWPAAVLPALAAIQRLPIYGPAGEGKYLAALKVAWDQIAIFSRLDVVGTGAESDAEATVLSSSVPVGEDLAYH